MKFTVDEKAYELDLDSLTFAEGRAIEKASGTPFAKVGEAAQAGSLAAIQAFIWVAMKRKDAPLRYSDLDDRLIDDVEFDDSDDEPDPTTGGDSPTSA